MAAPLGQVDFGQDVSTFPDLDPSFAPISGARAVAEAIARRLMTPRGTLPDFPNYGTDLRGWLNESFNLNGSTTTQMKNAIERECLQDERIQAADAGLYFDATSGIVNVTLSLQTSAGPFKLVLGVSALTIQLLQVG